jgi:hypothetical protein
MTLPIEIQKSLSSGATFEQLQRIATSDFDCPDLYNWDDSTLPKASDLMDASTNIQSNSSNSSKLESLEELKRALSRGDFYEQE